MTRAERIKAEIKVLIAARDWFRHKRPADWDVTRHVQQPTVNTTNDTEQALARAVAKLLADEAGA